MSKISVLFVTHVSSLGGANRSMLQLIIELRQRYGIEPFVLLPDDDIEQPLAAKLTSYSIPYIIAHFRRFKEADIPLITKLSYLKLTLNYHRIYKEIKDIKIDLIHSNSSVLDLGVYLSRKIKKKHVIHLREFGFEDFGIRSIFGEKYERLIYNSCDKLIAISKVVQLHFSTIVNREKINLIYNGLPDINQEQIAKHCNSILQFVCVGWINENKNQIEIINAIDLLVNKCKYSNFHLTLVGPCSATYYKEIDSYIHQKKIETFISFLGERQDVHNLLPLMDVGITPSNCEAFGRTTVEYMLHSLAVIANDAGANPEIVINEKTGLIYKEKDVESLAYKMKTLIDDYPMVSRYGSAGRQHALDNFSSACNSTMIHQLYSELLND